MVAASDVADFFIEEFKDSEDPMTKVRIQKFLYFAQAESLVRLHRPLFNEDFQAWHYGPVIPSISSQFMNLKDGEMISSPINKMDIHKFKPEEIEILMDVSTYCGRYSTTELSNKTHVDGGPWHSVHVEEGAPAIISKRSIEEFYSSHELIPHYFSNVVSSLPVEGRVDDNGKFLLTTDWE